MVLIDYKDTQFYMSKDLKKNLDNYKHEVLNKNTSLVMIIDGRSGQGKTTLSSQIGCYFSPDTFSLDHLCFTCEQFIEQLKKAKKGDCIVFDEGMLLTSRSAMSLINKAIIIMMSQIRSKNIFVIFNINSVFDLDKNIALHRADCLLHVYGEEGKLGSRGRFAVFPTKWGMLKNLYIHGKKFYSYAKPRAAFIDKFSKFFPFDDAEYEKKKQKAINEFMVNDKSSNTLTMIQRNKLIIYLKNQYNESTKKIAEISGLTDRTIRQVLFEHKHKHDD